MPSNELVISQQVISPQKTLDFSRYALNVSGDPKNGGRRAMIMVPVIDQNGWAIDAVNVLLAGADFDSFWSGFNSDKQLVDIVMKNQGVVSPDLSQIGDSITNVNP